VETPPPCLGGVFSWAAPRIWERSANDKNAKHKIVSVDFFTMVTKTIGELIMRLVFEKVHTSFAVARKSPDAQ
jgi:hypothetical protein